MCNIKFTRVCGSSHVCGSSTRRSRTSFAALQGRMHHQVQEVIIDQSQEMYEHITSSYITRGRCSAPDRSSGALEIQRGSSGKTRASQVHQDVCVPSYMWSELEFNASAGSFDQGDVQGHSMCMRPDTSDSFPGSGFTSGVVSHQMQISALQIQHGSEAGRVEIGREALQAAQCSVSCSVSTIVAGEEARGSLIVHEQAKKRQNKSETT